jgi:signal transduction histidine kinase
MRERAASIGAQVTVESRRGGGTRVAITVPAQAGVVVGGGVAR